jgi:hypothetical protein
MIRPQEVRDTAVTTAGDGYNSRQMGFDKHWGNAVCYVTVNRNLYWWTRITINTGITLRENTDACSLIKQYQIIREDAMTIDLESMIPGTSNAVAADYMDDLKAGTIITKLYSDLLQSILQGPVSGVTGTLGDDSAYGAFVVERSSVEFTRDDFSSLRITLRSLGYGNNTQIVSGDTT